jgi:hypothetical protein
VTNTASAPEFVGTSRSFVCTLPSLLDPSVLYRTIAFDGERPAEKVIHP